MPYIEQYKRNLIDLRLSDIENPGTLNYVITLICHKYIQHNGLRYQQLNEVVGVLECAKLELYRMVVAPYEDEKIAQNGFISDLDKGTHK